MSEKTKDPVPQGKYIPATRGGSLIFTAGMTPRKDGVLQFSGKVEAGEPLEKYREAARLAAANALTAARNRLEPGEKIARVLSMTVYVNAGEGFTGTAARAAVGVASLPGDAPVEVQIVCMVE